MKSLRTLFSCFALMVGIMCMSSASTAALSAPQPSDDITLDGYGLDSSAQVLEEVAVFAPDKGPADSAEMLKLQTYGEPVGLMSQWTSEVRFDMLAFTQAGLGTYRASTSRGELHDPTKRAFLWMKDLE